MTFVTAVAEETDDATFTEADIEREPGVGGGAQQPVRRQEADVGPRWAVARIAKHLQTWVFALEVSCGTVQGVASKLLKMPGPLVHLLLPSCQHAGCQRSAAKDIRCSTHDNCQSG